MALLSTTNIDAYGNQIRLYAEETGTNTSNNTSSIHAWLDLYVVSGGSVASSGISVGVTNNSSSLGYQYYSPGTHRLIDSYYSVGHNSDGSGSTYVSGYFNSYIGNWSLGGTLGLSKIPRYFSSTPSISQSSNTTTSVTISWSTSEARNWSQYKIDGGSWIDCNDKVASNNRSGSFVISNLHPNKEYKIVCQFKRSDSGLWSNSNTITAKTSTKTIHQYISNLYKDYTLYIRVNGVWKICVLYIRVNGAWKECK